jgi:prophage antirepressor-like protein
MDSQISVFDFNENPVRVLDQNGTTWFVAADVCRVLELGNVTETTRALDSDELNSVLLNSGPQGRKMVIISESGLYALVFKSRKPQAKAFRKWVTAEVLPALRKDGRYEMAAEAAEGAASLCHPVTVPQYVEEIGEGLELKEIIKLGTLCRLLARAFGVPYMLATHSAFGTLRAYPLELCRMAHAEVLRSIRPELGTGNEDFAVLEALAGLKCGPLGLKEIIEKAQEAGLWGNVAAVASSFKSIGRRLQSFVGQSFVTTEGERFIFCKHRTKSRVEYTFQPA